MSKNINSTFVDDGKEDVVFSINGQTFLVMPESGYKSLGMTYEQAQEIIAGLCNVVASLASALAQRGKDE